MSRCTQNMHIRVCLHIMCNPSLSSSLSLSPPLFFFFFLFSHCQLQASLEFRIFFLEVPSVGITSQCYHAPTHRNLCPHKLTYAHVLPGHTLQNQNFDIPNDLKAFWFMFLPFSAGGLYKFGHSCPLWKGLSCSPCPYV